MSRKEGRYGALSDPRENDKQYDDGSIEFKYEVGTAAGTGTLQQNPTSPVQTLDAFGNHGHRNFSGPTRPTHQTPKFDQMKAFGQVMVIGKYDPAVVKPQALSSEIINKVEQREFADKGNSVELGWKDDPEDNEMREQQREYQRMVYARAKAETVAQDYVSRLTVKPYIAIFALEIILLCWNRIAMSTLFELQPHFQLFVILDLSLYAVQFIQYSIMYAQSRSAWCHFTIFNKKTIWFRAFDRGTHLCHNIIGWICVFAYLINAQMAWNLIQYIQIHHVDTIITDHKTNQLLKDAIDILRFMIIARLFWIYLVLPLCCFYVCFIKSLDKLGCCNSLVQCIQRIAPDNINYCFQLPGIKSEVKASDPEEVVINKCRICRADFSVDDQRSLVVVNCENKHVFHAECMERWVERGNHWCPECGEEIQA